VCARSALQHSLWSGSALRYRSSPDPALTFPQLANALLGRHENQVCNRTASTAVIVEGINGHNGYVGDILGLGSYPKALEARRKRAWRPQWTEATLMSSCGHLLAMFGARMLRRIKHLQSMRGETRSFSHAGTMQSENLKIRCTDCQRRHGND
jgi:hypothetical protein